MNICADESVDGQIVDTLRQAGYSVSYVAEMRPGISDDEVLKSANMQSAVLLTADKDFGELVFRQKRASTGVILIRLAGLSPDNKSAIVSSALLEHGDEFLYSFTVISPGGIRIRKKTK